MRFAKPFLMITSSMLSLSAMAQAADFDVNSIPRDGKPAIKGKIDSNTISVGGNRYLIVEGNTSGMKNGSIIEFGNKVIDIERKIVGTLTGKIVVEMMPGANVSGVAQQYGLTVSTKAANTGYAVLKAQTPADLFNTVELLSQNALVKKAYLDIKNEQIRPM